MKFKRTLGIPALALLLATVACDDGLTGVNINPNEPESVPPENLLANAIVEGVGDSYGTHGVWSGLQLFQLWSQYQTQPVYHDESRYSPRPNVVTSIWDANFSGPLADLNVVKEAALETDNLDLFATSEILTQYLYQYLTDIFGDIPYSEALRAPEITAPRYDAQQDVYAGLLAALANASSQIDRGNASTGFAAGDFIYAGNMEKWYRFANSLRMRIAMRLAEVDPATAEQEFAAAYQAGGFESNGDNALIVWSSSVPNQNRWYDLYFNQNRRDQVLAASLVDRLNDWNDPRVEVFGQPAESDGAYRGLQAGRRPGELGMEEADYSLIGTYFLRPESPTVLMAYSEVLFLQAEAAVRGWIGGDPAALYEEAIRASLEQYNIPEADIAAYLAQPAVQYSGLEDIYEQEWVALFGAGATEGWALVRRTGSPALAPAVGAEIPARLYYPDQEALYNPSNYREMSLFDKMWWMP